MMKQFTKTDKGKAAELFTNAWPPDIRYTPEGQVEIWTTRGKSVVMTGTEFLDYVFPIIRETCSSEVLLAHVEAVLKGERHGS